MKNGKEDEYSVKVNAILGLRGQMKVNMIYVCEEFDAISEDMTSLDAHTNNTGTVNILRRIIEDRARYMILNKVKGLT